MATFTFTITSTADAAGDTSLGTFDDRGNGSGTLRQAINFANQFAGDPDAEPVPITVQAGITGTITLTGNLPLVASSVDLDASNLTLDGQGAYRGFLISGISSATGVDAAPTTVNISNLTIQNVRAKGGDSGDFGGGGLGAGGAVFVGPAASVTLTNVNVVTTSALGGDSVYNSRGVGGGGGLGGDGGDGSFQGGTSSGGGGGGILAAGGVGGVYNAGNSNGGGGGGGISSPGEAGSPAGPGRGGKGTNGLGGGGDGGAQAYGGGNAGFGGGGGGGFINPGGDGGFGGGGGGFGGDGGFGGGGGYELGGGKGGFGGGGALKKLDSVGNPISSQGGFAAGTGGGGGALGGAIFVAAGGTITIAGDSVQTGGSVTGGRNLNVFSSQNNGRASAYGAGIFYEGGSAGATAMLNFGAGNQSYADQIADLNGAAGNTTTDNGLGGVGGIVGLAKTGSGALTLGGVNTYTGGTTIITGTIRVGSDTALGASSGRLTFKSGALNTTAGVTSARAVTIFGSGTLQVDGAATTTLSGDIADGTVQTPETNVTIPGMLIKTGTGTLILSGASTYSGGTMIAAGTLNLSASAILSGTMISMGPAGTGIISFRAAAGQTATLALETAAQPSSGATFAYMLADFGANDVLNLKGFGPSATTSVSYAGGTLTVTNAGTSESFMLTNPEEARYRVSDDGNGGVLINSIDTTAPTRPAAPMVVASSDTGRSSTDGITKDATPTLTGTTEVGARVSLYEGKTFLAAAVAGTNGMYTITSPTLADGKHILNVTATDAAGNVSAISTGRQITIDTAAPARPAQPTLSAASDTGRSSTDGNTRDTTPTLTGTAEAGATISLYEGKTLLATAIASAGGTYAITSPQLADGRHVLNVTATDAAGNVSAFSIGRQVTIDTTRPTTPAAPILAAASDTGTSSSDGITRDTTPTFTGTADAGTTITLYDGTTKVGSATAGSTGSYTVTASALADGAHSIRVGATDAAGNVSALSPIKRVAIDTMAPATSITNSGGSTSQTSQTITGTGEFGTTVTLTDNGMNVGTATVGSKGTWSSQIMLSSGINRIFASDTDKAGNVGKSQTVDFDYKPDSGSRIASLALPSNDAVSPAAHAFANADLTMALFNAVFAPSHVEATVPDPLPAPDLLAVMGLANPAR